MIPLTSCPHSRFEVEGLLVVVEGGGQEAQLVHGATQVVVRLLAAAAQVEVRVEEGAGLGEEKTRIQISIQPVCWCLRIFPFQDTVYCV